MAFTLQLWLLGSWHGEIDGAPLGVLPTRHTRALLARLALIHPQSLSRTQLQLDLFPTSAPELAAQSLRNTLYYLRRTLGNFLVMDGDEISLAPNLRVLSDVAEFQSAARSAAFDELAHALELYRGPFLDKPMDGWAMLFARQMDAMYVNVLRRAARRVPSSGRARARGALRHASCRTHESFRARRRLAACI